MTSESRKTTFGIIRLVGLIIVLLTSVSIYWLTQWNDEDYRRECNVLAQNEDWTKLRELAGEWVDRTTAPDEALTLLAEAEYQDGFPDRAVEHLLAIPERSKRAYTALIAACDMQFGELNKPLEGVETLKRMVKLRPSSITSRRRLIFFYAVTLQRRAMVEAIHDAIRRKAEPPDAYAYLMLADKLSFSNGFTKNTEWLESDPESELFQVARIIQLLDSVSSSDSDSRRATLPQYMKVFHELRKKFPGNLELINYEVAAAIEDFDVDKVEQLLGEVSDKTGHYLLLKSKGWLAMQNDEFSRAETLFLASIAEFSLDWSTWHQLAACRRRLGKLDEAVTSEQIARIGKELQKEILQQKNTAAIDTKTLEKIASYAASCADDLVAAGILMRLSSGQTPL